MEEEREEEVEEEGLEGVEENLERGDVVVGEGGYLKEESDYHMMAEGDKVPPDQENSKGIKNLLSSKYVILLFFYIFSSPVAGSNGTSLASKFDWPDNTFKGR